MTLAVADCCPAILATRATTCPLSALLGPPQLEVAAPRCSGSSAVGGVGKHEVVDNAWPQAKYGIPAADVDHATLRA